MRDPFFDPHALPAPAPIRRRAQALAMLDAIISPEWSSRYFSYDAHWSEGQEMSSMRDGSGDEWFMLFDAAGVAIKGLAHESALAGTEMVRAAQATVPAVFASFLSEPAFGWDYASFCYWRGAEDAAWSRVAHPDLALAGKDDGSREWLMHLVEPSAFYQAWAADYYEIEAPLEVIEAIHAGTPLTPALAGALNPEQDWDETLGYAHEIGYPIA